MTNAQGALVVLAAALVAADSAGERTTPAAALKMDEIDAPAPTAVQEAARAAEVRGAMGAHGHGHGAYVHRDAGRSGGTTPPPSKAAPPGSGSTPDPHAGHRMPPSPRPSASPSPSPSPHHQHQHGEDR